MRTTKATLPITTLLASLLALPLHATVQLPDQLEYKGDTFPLTISPLALHFAMNPELKPAEGLITPSILRGYVATLGLENDVLVLNALNIERLDERDGCKINEVDIIDQQYPDQISRTLNWFSGVIPLAIHHASQKNQVIYADPEGLVAYDYLLLHIESGQLVKRELMSQTQYQAYHQQQFEQYKDTAQYQTQRQQLQQHGNLSAQDVEQLIFQQNSFSLLAVQPQPRAAKKR